MSQYTARLLKALIDRRDGWRYGLLCRRNPCGSVPGDALSSPLMRFPNRTLWMQVMLPVALARLLEMFSGVCWHEFERGEETVTFPTELAPLQRQLLELLEVDPAAYA